MVTEQDLRKIPLLKDFEDEELTRLTKILHRKKISKNAFIVHSQDDGAELMFIEKGNVNVTLVGGDAREVILAQLGEGQFFGEISMLTGESRSANVVAASDCVILVLSRRDFENHLRSGSELSLALLRELALRLKASSGKIGDLALLDVYRRVARVLDELSVEKEIDGDLVGFVEKRPTHKDLAAMAGTSREMVTRALKGLEKDGYIEVDGKQIKIYGMPEDC